jgi:hypothetical protein
MTQRVLFLDIDGVLNSEWWFVNRPEKGGLRTQIDPNCVSILNRIIKETDCAIVVSSTWRKVHRSDIIPVLTDRGLLYSGIWDYTPILYKQRGFEIEEWLSERSEDIISYAIVDDDSDMLPKQLLNYVQTDWKIGLDNITADRLIKILNSK